MDFIYRGRRWTWREVLAFVWAVIADVVQALVVGPPEFEPC